MKVFFLRVTAITFCVVTAFSTSWYVSAEEQPNKSKTTWQDLGLNLPKDFPTNEISLFEGLNNACGTWSFEGETVNGDTTSPLKGSLDVLAMPQGMIPLWSMTWKWSENDSELAIVYIVSAGPRKDGFDLMLTRMGPANILEVNKPQPGVLPTIFNGTWNAENRMLTWIEGGTPPGLPVEATVDDTAKPKQSFEMVVAADGKVLIQSSEHTSKGQIVSAKTTIRTAEATKKPTLLTGKHAFKNVDEIVDQRIKPWLPQEARDITLFSESGGHYARYAVTEKDFKAFLDKLWEDQGEGSAHDRDSMSGEGKPANRERMAQRFESLGWEPLENAVIFYSPSKRNGAMTTYYYDAQTGVAYHDRGYW